MGHYFFKKIFNLFPREHVLIEGKSYLCIDDKIEGFTVGKIYYCNQTDYLEDDDGRSDVYGDYKSFWKCFIEV